MPSGLGLNLDDAALEHGDHVRAARVGLLVLDELGQLADREVAEPGAQRRDRQLVVVRQRQRAAGRRPRTAAAGTTAGSTATGRPRRLRRRPAPARPRSRAPRSRPRPPRPRRSPARRRRSRRRFRPRRLDLGRLDRDGLDHDGLGRDGLGRGRFRAGRRPGSVAASTASAAGAGVSWAVVAAAGACAAGLERALSLTPSSEPKLANIARSMDAGRSLVCGALIYHTPRFNRWDKSASGNARPVCVNKGGTDGLPSAAEKPRPAGHPAPLARPRHGRRPASGAAGLA